MPSTSGFWVGISWGQSEFFLAVKPSTGSGARHLHKIPLLPSCQARVPTASSKRTLQVPFRQQASSKAEKRRSSMSGSSPPAKKHSRQTGGIDVLSERCRNDFLTQPRRNESGMRNCWLCKTIAKQDQKIDGS